MMRFFFEREGNILGKGEKYWLPVFSPFPTMFSNDLFLRALELQVGLSKTFSPFPNDKF